jgi:hypothetical protein
VLPRGHVDIVFPGDPGPAATAATSFDPRQRRVAPAIVKQFPYQKPAKKSAKAIYCAKYRFIFSIAAE